MTNPSFLADGGFEMIKAFFVDFYGTLVHEDGAVIKQITDIICATGKVENRKDARAYKPRAELFNLALKKCGFSADEVIHIGDSISSDVKGASSIGIKPLWLNRFGKELPEGVESIKSLLDAIDVLG